MAQNQQLGPLDSVVQGIGQGVFLYIFGIVALAVISLVVVGIQHLVLGEDGVKNMIQKDRDADNYVTTNDFVVEPQGILCWKNGYQEGFIKRIPDNATLVYLSRKFPDFKFNREATLQARHATGYKSDDN